MGISSANLDLILNVEGLLGGWEGRRILELGNQIMRGGPGRRTGKQYFTALGAEHVSIDLNGEDGAVPLDLCRPLPEQYHDSFDVVTNFGTSEHIEDQVQVFKTIHDCCKVGGYMIHSVPLVGYWDGHSPHHYRQNLGFGLVVAFSYKPIFTAVVDRQGNKLLNLLLMRTKESEFHADKFPHSEVEKTRNFSKDSNNRFLGS